MRSCRACCRWPCFSGGVGLDDPERSLQALIILWFCVNVLLRLCSHLLCVFCLQNTLEQCSVCAKPIMERILRATGKAYHPHCFTCVMCHRSLDGIPFTVDAGGNIHCIEDFHKYGPSYSQWLCSLTFSLVPKNPPFYFWMSRKIWTLRHFLPRLLNSRQSFASSRRTVAYKINWLGTSAAWSRFCLDLNLYIIFCVPLF